MKSLVVLLICQNAMVHGLNYITFYVQKYIDHLAACSGPRPVLDGPLGAPAFAKFACLKLAVSSVDHFNSLWHSGAIWWQRSRSTLAHVMACCLTAPNHYLNKCWHSISTVRSHSSEGSITRDSSGIRHWILFKNYFSKILFKFLRGQWVMWHYMANKRIYQISISKKMKTI